VSSLAILSFYDVLMFTVREYYFHATDWNVRYQRAYLDFFEDEVVRQRYDWKEVVYRSLLEGENPLINCIISGGRKSSPLPLHLFLLSFIFYII
jgi:hypothetical protein